MMCTHRHTNFVKTNFWNNAFFVKDFLKFPSDAKFRETARQNWEILRYVEHSAHAHNIFSKLFLIFKITIFYEKYGLFWFWVHFQHVETSVPRAKFSEFLNHISGCLHNFCQTCMTVSLKVFDMNYFSLKFLGLGCIWTVPLKLENFMLVKVDGFWVKITKIDSDFGFWNLAPKKSKSSNFDEHEIFEF